MSGTENNVKQLNGQANANQEQPQQELKPKIHLRLKIDLTTWHLTPFKGELNLQPGSRVTGHQYTFLCFTLFYTKRS